MISYVRNLVARQPRDFAESRSVAAAEAGRVLTVSCAAVRRAHAPRGAYALRAERSCRGGPRKPPGALRTWRSVEGVARWSRVGRGEARVPAAALPRLDGRRPAGARMSTSPTAVAGAWSAAASAVSGSRALRRRHPRRVRAPGPKVPVPVDGEHRRTLSRPPCWRFSRSRDRSVPALLPHLQ
jgi:hypothetical protein